MMILYSGTEIYREASLQDIYAKESDTKPD